MKDFGIRKYAVTEVVLLAVLVVGLIISQSIVLNRSYIKLSAPNEVPASGFFFSMPKGSGWETMPALRFAQNGCYLNSIQSREGKNAASITVSYLFAAGKPDANDWLATRAAQLGENLYDKRIIRGKEVVTYAAMIDLRGKPLNIYYGIASLPGGRSITIELVETTDDPDWGWNILSRVAESFAFEGNPLLQAGEKVVLSLRSNGLGKTLGMSEQKNYFLLSDNDRLEGFAVEMYAHAGAGAPLNVRAIDSYFLQSQGVRESILQTNDRLERFVWTSNTLNSAGVRKETLEVRLGDNSTMTVRQEGGLAPETYILGPAAVPDAFSVAVFRQMLTDGTKEAIVDFVSSEGQIIPVIVQLQDQPADANGRSEHIVKMKYFGGVQISEEIRLDADGRKVMDAVSGQMSYVLRRGSKDVILKEFPLWLDYIMNLDKLLKEDVKDGKKDLRRIVRNAGTII